MARKIIIRLGVGKDDKAGFKFGNILPKVPKVEWHGIPRFKQEDRELPVQAFRQLLSDEKARILHTMASKKPNSIYALARLLGRDFKAVREDLKLLESFGLVSLVKEKSGKRSRLRPVLAVDRLDISFELK
jgi:DNA-binding transcriptional ArsR family regulator